MLWHRLRYQARVYAFSDLAAGQREIGEAVEILLVDDGLRQKELGCSLSIMTVNGSVMPSPFPMGDGRVDVDRLPATDIVWRYKVELANAVADPRIVESRYRVEGLVNWKGEFMASNELRGKAVTVVSGVARPDSLLKSVTSLGAKIMEVYEFGDHEKFVFPKRTDNSSLVITTEKDLHRMGAPPHVWALRIGLEFVGGRSTLDRLVSAQLASLGRSTCDS